MDLPRLGPTIDNSKLSQSTMEVEVGGGGPTSTMTIPSIISWNCRGVNSNCFVRHLQELLRVHRLDILVLLETHC